jgi:signal transduction histidine kinase
MADAAASAANPWQPPAFAAGGAAPMLASNLAVALAYFALALIVSRFFAAYGLFPAPIWLPASVAMVGALAGGNAIVPGIFAGAFFANYVLFDPPVAEAAAIAATNTAGPVIGAALLRRLHPRQGLFDSFAGAVAFLVATTLVAPAITALGGAAALSLGRPFDPGAFYAIWLGWWLSDSGGTLFLAGSAMLWLGLEKGSRGTAEPLAPREFAVWAAVAAGTCVLFLSRALPGSEIKWAFPFLLVVPIAWIALRMSLRAALTLVSLVAIVASAGTVAGVGPFQTGAGNSLQLVGVLVVLLAMTVLTILALVAERHVAQSESRVKSMFLATASHELRTPLNTIIGLSSLLAEGRPQDAARAAGYARDIERSGEHLMALIDDLLDLSRLEAGRVDLREAPVEVDELFASAAGIVGPQARARAIAVDAGEDTGLVVRGDRKALLQIAINLLSNAVKFSPSGGRVTLSAARGPDGATTLRVADTGPGISQDALDKVFQPFERARDGAASDVPGTGLGLSIARGLAELHGGTLTLENLPGGGACAVLRLPPSRAGAAARG